MCRKCLYHTTTSCFFRGHLSKQCNKTQLLAKLETASNAQSTPIHENPPAYTPFVLAPTPGGSHLRSVLVIHGSIQRQPKNRRYSDEERGVHRYGGNRAGECAHVNRCGRLKEVSKVECCEKVSILIPNARLMLKYW